MSMTSEQVELRFCDLCGRSIPDREFAEGMTRRAGDKLVGACCLAPLGAVAGSTPAKPSHAASTPWLIPVGFGLLLASVFGAAWWLEGRIRARDPGERIAQVEGKVAGLVAAIDAAETRATAERTEMRTSLEEMFAKDIAAVTTNLEDLQAALPKEGAGIAELRGSLERLAGAVTDLSARQGIVESGLVKQADTLQRELAVVARALVDLRRKAMTDAAKIADVGDAGTSESVVPKVESLPEKLGKRVDQLASDNAGTRWEAVDELLRSGDKRVVPYVLPRLRDEDPFVRRLVAEGLPSVADVSVCGSLVDALEDSESIVREAAHKSLIALSAQRLPFDPEGSETARNAQIAKWKAWWKSRG